jgi:hypothetical protein
VVADPALPVGRQRLQSHQVDADGVFACGGGSRIQEVFRQAERFDLAVGRQARHGEIEIGMATEAGQRWRNAWTASVAAPSTTWRRRSSAFNSSAHWRRRSA